jgi:hypothetical protein
MGVMLPFGIVKRADGRTVWLTRALPFVTWGLQTGALRYPTKNHAWQDIARLSPRDANGAMVIPLDGDSTQSP